MGSVNEPNPRVDPTVRIYDGFYGYETEVDANDYDVVNSFFESVFGTSQAAANFSVTLFRIADETNTPIMTLLVEIQDQDKIQLTNTLCYYLNGLRSSTTLLGITAVSTPVVWTARNILP